MCGEVPDYYIPSTLVIPVWVPYVKEIAIFSFETTVFLLVLTDFVSVELVDSDTLGVVGVTAGDSCTFSDFKGKDDYDSDTFSYYNYADFKRLSPRYFIGKSVVALTS